MSKRSSFRFRPLAVGICATLSLVSSLGAQNAPGRQGSSSAVDVWTLGVARTDPFTGRIQGEYFYCSGCGSFINPFSPLPLRSTRVRTLNLLVSNRQGSYGQQLLLRVEVRDFAGNLRRTVSATPVDLETIPELVFQPVPISTNPAHTEVLPGEYLAVHVAPASGSGGTLSVLVFMIAEVTSP